MKLIEGKEVFVLRYAASNPLSPEGVDELAKNLRRQNRGSLVVVMPDDLDLESLDEEQMRRHGWIRDPDWVEPPPTSPGRGDVVRTP